MIRTTRKWFWVWDYDKEEEWLNKMAAMGLAMSGVGFARYTFKEGPPANTSTGCSCWRICPATPRACSICAFWRRQGWSMLRA